MKLTNQAWILVTLLSLGIVWIEIVQRGRPGWASLPAFFLLFAVGAAWIRGYHQRSKEDD